MSEPLMNRSEEPKSGDSLPSTRSSSSGELSLTRKTAPLLSSSTVSSSPPLNASTPSLLEERASAKAPSWLRPFFSLRVQLIATYIISLMMVITLVCMLTYKQTDLTYISIVALSVLVLGALISLAFITLLLRPLWRVTDVAQALAVGDFKQRQRLPMRQPPQDEIDRLAGSLDEMVKRLERAEELQHASEQRFTRFFSDASHQLRTPLTSIRGFTEVLMRGAKDDPETAQRVLKRMKGEGERMTAIINDFLTLARLDDTQLLKRQYVDLSDIAAESVEQIKTRANAERSITLTVLTKDDYGLQGDRERLKQLFFILLDNALKYGRQTPDSQVTLELAKEGNQATIRVIDNGEGITEKDMDHIFDAFYRGAPRPSSASNGTPTTGVGLGLTIAAAVARAHNGSITASSTPGVGSTFTVLLPCLE